MRAIKRSGLIALLLLLIFLDSPITTNEISKMGVVRQALKEAVQGEGVTLIVLGSPSGEESVFNLKGLETYASDIEAETGINTAII